MDLLDVRQKPKFFAPKLGEDGSGRFQGRFTSTKGCGVRQQSTALFITEIEAFQHSPCF